jgi:hypothetical protein
MIGVTELFIIGPPYVIQLQRKVLFVSKLSKLLWNFQRRWKSLKKAALESDPGPMGHGNLKKQNRHKGSFAAATKDDAIEFLVDLGQKEGKSYATCFIQERTLILIRKDEEDLMELPSSYSKRKIYEK